MNELNFVLDSCNIDILGICETKIDAKFKIKSSKYKIYRSDRNSVGGGVALFINKNIKHEQTFLAVLKNIEAVAVEVWTGATKILVFNIYIPPHNRITIEDFNKLFHSGSKVIAFGDFNAKNIEWNCFSNNLNGKNLSRICSKLKLKLHAPYMPTHFPTRGKPSIIDFFITKNVFNVSQPIAFHIFSSDHNPVGLKILEKPIKIGKQPIYDLSKAKWNKFQDELNQSIVINKFINNRAEIESFLSRLTSSINIAIANNVPLKNNKKNTYSISNRVIKSLITFKNRVRKSWQLSRKYLYKNFMKFLQKLINSQLHKLKNDKWRSILKKASFKDHSLWKLSKQYKRAVNDIPPLIFNNNNDMAYSNSDKVNVLVDHYFRVHGQNENLGKDYFKKMVTTTVNKFVNRTKINIDDIQFSSGKEVVRYIKSLKNHKAPGIDNITGIILKKLPKKGIAAIVNIVNSMFRLGYFSNQWKVAKVICILKPGKNPALPVSYRPISLLPHLSKVVEKIIKSRIIDIADKLDILPKEQFGFRNYHGTTDQLCRIVNFITHNFNHKKHTGMALLDIEKAFDTVWHNGIIYKMINYGFPSYLILLINNYLRLRQMIVSYDNAVSNEKRIVSGVPQGSVLGPVLFILYVSDMPKIKQLHYGLYADDLCMYISSYRIDTIINFLNKGLTSVYKYYDRWKIKLNVGKTEAIIFSKRRPLIINSLCLNNIKIEWSKSVVYLGLTLDKSLTFTKHIDYVCNRAIGKLVQYYPLLHRYAKLSTENKLIMYKVIARTVMVYACPVWGGIISKTNLNRLQVVQNKFLRLVGNFRMYTPIIEMHETLNIDKIYEHVKTLSINFFNRIKNHENVLMREIDYVDSNFKHKRIKNLIL